MDEATVTQVMAAALDARGIAYTPSQAEAAHLGREYVAPAAPAAAPQKPAAPAETHDQMIARLTAPDVGNDEVTAAAMARPATADAYELPGIQPGAQFTPEQTATIGAARAALFEAGFPASIGKLVAERIDAAAANPPNDLQRSHAQAATLSQLRQTWGDKFDSNLAAVRGEIQRIAQKVPAVTEWLERTGAGNDVVVIRHLHNVLTARAKG